MIIIIITTLNKIAIGRPLLKHVPGTEADAHGCNLNSPNLFLVPLNCLI